MISILGVDFNERENTLLLKQIVIILFYFVKKTVDWLF